MVYLVRTAHIINDWEKVGELYRDLSTHIKEKYEQVKDSYFLLNIAGPVDQIHWVIAFDSLADEESYAHKVMDDPKYVEAMKMTMDLMSPPVDRLYRKIF